MKRFGEVHSPGFIKCKSHITFYFIGGFWMLYSFNPISFQKKCCKMVCLSAYPDNNSIIESLCTLYRELGALPFISFRASTYNFHMSAKCLIIGLNSRFPGWNTETNTRYFKGDCFLDMNRVWCYFNWFNPSFVKFYMKTGLYKLFNRLSSI